MQFSVQHLVPDPLVADKRRNTLTKGIEAKQRRLQCHYPAVATRWLLFRPDMSASLTLREGERGRNHWALCGTVCQKQAWHPAAAAMACHLGLQGNLVGAIKHVLKSTVQAGTMDAACYTNQQWGSALTCKLQRYTV